MCPHCRSKLSKWQVPVDASWDEAFLLVCFNNDCSYYQDGWKWMKEQFNQKASYRYMTSPSTGVPSMIPVWSDDATRELIMDESEGDQP